MKTTISAALLLALSTVFLTPAEAAFAPASAGIHALTIDMGMTVEKRRKPRVPGGSGCDTPRDLIQHPECRV